MNNEIKAELAEFAVTTLRNLVEHRGLTQTHLADISGVAQSEISKIFRSEKTPSLEQLRKLANALGIKLSDILNGTDGSHDEILGYLATPLTAVVTKRAKAECILEVVQKIRAIASNTEFTEPCFNLYWPGDYTHPINNKEIPANQVYLMDRSRASAFDFIVLFCPEPSYGVGQENEISTQAGLPAIRLFPESMSRMMRGSFIRSMDVGYSGSLTASVDFDESQFNEALQEIRRAYFRIQALYGKMNGNNFGERLRHLINDRLGDYATFADDIGISLGYVNTMMEEPFIVSNPSVLLLRRMSARLGVSVGHLLGETRQLDPVIVESTASWNQWLKESGLIDGALAVEIKDEWEGKVMSARAASVGSARNQAGTSVMTMADWDRRYQKKARPSRNGSQKNLF